jgi:aryl-alcohol dehydrogenase-like predicted oxidoreductase
LIAQALGDVRTRVVIATKFGADFRFGEPVRHVYTPEYLAYAIDESLRRLRTDYVDVYQVHNPPQKLAREEAIWDALAALKASGKIRAYGVSCRTTNDAVAYLRAEEKFGPRFGDTLQVAYNMIDREAAAKDVFVEAHRQDRGVIGRVPLASGVLSGKYDRYHAFAPGDFRNDWGPARRQATAERLEALSFLERPDRTLAQSAIAFCLSEPAMGTVITGARTADQVEENASASDVAPLSSEELAQIHTYP